MNFTNLKQEFEQIAIGIFKINKYAIKMAQFK